MRVFAGAVVGVLVGLVVIAGIPGPQETAAQESRSAVTKAQYDRWKTELSNWGRWGRDDEIGTMNLITPEKRREAAALVNEGFSVSLAQDALTEEAEDNSNPYVRIVTSTGPDSAANDYYTIRFHGLAHTHLDALGHMLFDGKFYNGFSAAEVITKENGATKGGINNLKTGIFTRGILMDIARLKGVPYLDLESRIYTEDLEAWERKAGVKVSAGDALFIRTGRWARRAELGPWNVIRQSAGVDPSVIPWLKERDIALLGSDAATDARPGPDVGATLPVHDFVLIILGVHVFDNVNLEELSEAAAARNRWEFLLTAAPLPVNGGTGSPINPIATF